MTSNSATPESRPSSPHRPTGDRYRSPWKRWGVYVPLVVFLAVVVVTGIYFFTHDLFPKPEDPPVIVQNGRARAIQLDILNAAGVKKLARMTTDYLRREGFDVVEIGTYNAAPVEVSIVIDRANNPKAALRVAKALGLAPDRVVEKPDPNLYLDVTVVIGKDYKSLKPLKDL